MIPVLGCAPPLVFSGLGQGSISKSGVRQLSLKIMLSAPWGTPRAAHPTAPSRRGIHFSRLFQSISSDEEPPRSGIFSTSLSSVCIADFSIAESGHEDDGNGRELEFVCEQGVRCSDQCRPTSFLDEHQQGLHTLHVPFLQSEVGGCAVGRFVDDARISTKGSQQFDHVHVILSHSNVQSRALGLGSMR